MNFLKLLFLLSVVLFTGILTFAQDINQLDANGKRHGIWKKTFDDSKILRYEGEFDHGVEIGLFKFYKNIDNKAVLTATKKFDGVKGTAYVTFYASTGKVISEGLMIGKLFIGEWKYYQQRSNDLLTLEHYNNDGLLDGDRLVYYENSQIAEKKHYSNGKLDGSSVWFSENGTMLKEFFYVNDELHGPSKYYSPKGEIIAEGRYKNGQKNGVWKFYEDGKLKEEKDFSK